MLKAPSDSLSGPNLKLKLAHCPKCNANLIVPEETDRMSRHPSCTGAIVEYDSEEEGPFADQTIVVPAPFELTRARHAESNHWNSPGCRRSHRRRKR